jgi:lipoic acid synthetase
MQQKKIFLPYWFKQDLLGANALKKTSSLIDRLNLHTVCRSAHCPNLGACFAKGRATFMIMGDTCTRNCRFCAVRKGNPLPIDQREPQRVAQAIKDLNPKHAVITSVSRDDLFDGGASQFARTINSIRELMVDTTIEVLVPDFQGSAEALKVIVDAQPNCINHNLETVPRLYKYVRPQAIYKRSLELLSRIKQFDDSIFTKSGLIVGLGERFSEVAGVMEDLRQVGCDILTIGQYLSPSKEHIEVKQFINPNQFDEYKKIGLFLGFRYVASGPLVRSSYGAEEIFLKCMT